MYRVSWRSYLLTLSLRRLSDSCPETFDHLTFVLVVSLWQRNQIRCTYRLILPHMGSSPMLLRGIVYLVLDIIQDLQREGSLYSESKRATPPAASPAQPPGWHILHIEDCSPQHLLQEWGIRDETELRCECPSSWTFEYHTAIKTCFASSCL